MLCVTFSQTAFCFLSILKFSLRNFLSHNLLLRIVCFNHYYQTTTKQSTLGNIRACDAILLLIRFVKYWWNFMNVHDIFGFVKWLEMNFVMKFSRIAFVILFEEKFAVTKFESACWIFEVKLYPILENMISLFWIRSND